MITCENCVYFKSMMQNSVRGIGKCVRHSPRSGDIQTGGAWPFVYYDQACGEFISKVNGEDYNSTYEYDDEEEYT